MNLQPKPDELDLDSPNYTDPEQHPAFTEHDPEVSDHLLSPEEYAAAMRGIREEGEGLKNTDGIGFDLTDDDDWEDDDWEQGDDHYDDVSDWYDHGYNDGWNAAYVQYPIMRLFRRLKLLRSNLKWKAHDLRRALLNRHHDDSDTPF